MIHIIICFTSIQFIALKIHNLQTALCTAMVNFFNNEPYQCSKIPPKIKLQTRMTRIIIYIIISKTFYPLKIRALEMNQDKPIVKATHYNSNHVLLAIMVLAIISGFSLAYLLMGLVYNL